MLELHDVDTYYGPSQVLHGVSLQINQGEIVCLLGANAAGKTTTMKTIFGLVPPRRGTVIFEGKRLDGRTPDQVIKEGLALVPRGAASLFAHVGPREPRDGRLHAERQVSQCRGH